MISVTVMFAAYFCYPQVARKFLSKSSEVRKLTFQHTFYLKYPFPKGQKDCPDQITKAPAINHRCLSNSNGMKNGSELQTHTNLFSICMTNFVIYLLLKRKSVTFSTLTYITEGRASVVTFVLFHLVHVWKMLSDLCGAFICLLRSA